MAERRSGIGLGQRLLNRPDTVGRVGGLAPWLGNMILDSKLARRIAERLFGIDRSARSEEHTSELQSLMRISYAVFCLKKKKLYQLVHISYDRFHLKNN